jgi:hypothetical protein
MRNEFRVWEKRVLRKTFGTYEEEANRKVKKTA